MTATPSAPPGTTSTTSTTTDPTYVAVVTIPVSDAARQEELLEVLVRDVRDWVCRLPGFVSATYHASADGRQVLNYARWTSEQAYLDGFRADPRSGRLRSEIVRLSDGAGPSMTAYTVAASVPAME